MQRDLLDLSVRPVIEATPDREARRAWLDTKEPLVCQGSLDQRGSLDLVGLLAALAARDPWVLLEQLVCMASTGRWAQLA